jgi:hypothetical protein
VILKCPLFSAVALCLLFACVFPEVAGTADDVNTGSILGSIVKDPRSLGDTLEVGLYRDDTAAGLLKRQAGRQTPFRVLTTRTDSYRFDSLPAGSYRIEIRNGGISVGIKEGISLPQGGREKVDIAVVTVVTVMLSIAPARDVQIDSIVIDNGKVQKEAGGYLLTVAGVDSQVLEIKFTRNGISDSMPAPIILRDTASIIIPPIDTLKLRITPSYESDCLVPGAIACYSFDNGRSDDKSGNGNNGRVVGATPTADRFGNPAGALQFNGVDNYVIVDSLKGTTPGNSPKSISGWFKSGKSDKYLQMLFGFGAAQEGNNFQVGVGPVSGTTPPYAFRVNGWGDGRDWRTDLSPGWYFDGKWHHCAVTYDGTVTKVYFDGAFAGETESMFYDTVNRAQVQADTFPVLDTIYRYDRVSATYDTVYKRIKGFTGYCFITPPAPTLVIGNEIDLNEWEFDGSLDDIRIFNRAIDGDEVQRLYNQKKE